MIPSLLSGGGVFAGVLKNAVTSEHSSTLSHCCSETLKPVYRIQVTTKLMQVIIDIDAKQDANNFHLSHCFKFCL